MKNKPIGRQRLIFLTVAIAAAVAVGVWLFALPAMEKQKALDRQRELIASITEGDGAITLPAAFVTGDVDFYDGADEVIPEPEASAPDMAAEESQSGVTEPAPTEAPAEPSVITGVGILSIEKINLQLPVVDGVTKAQLKIAVGRVPETAEIGAAGNAVIAGHRSYTYGDYFNRLGEMEIGDVIEYTPKGGGTMRFEVYDVLTVEPGDQTAFRQEDYAEITLLTCTPIRTATHRLLVRAKLI